MDYIQSENLKFSYEAQEGELPIEILHGVTLGIKKGEFVALLGHNGVGNPR